MRHDVEKLAAWTRSAAIDPECFACVHSVECQASCKGTLEPMMTYVGRSYGSRLRMALVGMDHGEPERATVEQRQAGITRSYQELRCNFNPHYRGVVRTAGACLGAFGRSCREECLKRCRGRGANCVLDVIAQPNLVKCVPNTVHNRTSLTTDVMRHNCAGHLVAELKILQPSFIVFHGVKARGAFLPALGTGATAVSDICDRHGPVIYRSAELDAHLLFLDHPSRGWLERQWGAVVEPALRWLRERDVIPNVDE